MISLSSVGASEQQHRRLQYCEITTEALDYQEKLDKIFLFQCLYWMLQFVLRLALWNLNRILWQTVSVATQQHEIKLLHARV